MEEASRTSLLSCAADCALGISLAGLSYLLPMPHGARPALPALLLLAAFLLRPGAPIIRCGPAFFLGLGLSPLIFLSDLASGSLPEWVICAAGSALLLSLPLLRRLPQDQGSSRHAAGLLAAFCFGLLVEGLRAASGITLSTVAGAGPAAEIALECPLALSFGAGLLAGSFINRRMPRLIPWLLPSALLAASAFTLLRVPPTPSLFRMALLVHKPDDTALAFAAGNLFIALRICGLSSALLGTAFSMGLQDLGFRRGMITAFFLAWSAGFLLPRLIPLIDSPFFRSGAGLLLTAGLPPVLLGLAWIPLYHRSRRRHAVPYLLACIPLGLLALHAVRLDAALPGLTASSPAIFQGEERFGIESETLRLEGDAEILRLYGPEDEQVVIRGRLIADGRLSYRFTWSQALTNLIRFFGSASGTEDALILVGREADLLPFPSVSRNPAGPAACVLLPSVLREGSSAAGRFLAAFEERDGALAAILDLSTLSRRGLRILIQRLAGMRPGLSFWLETPYLMIVAAPESESFDLDDDFSRLLERDDSDGWRLPCPVPRSAFEAPGEPALRARNALSFTLALELPGRRGPFPDPRIAAEHLGPIIAELPHPPCRTGLRAEEAFLYRCSLVLGAALRYYRGCIADELRLLHVLSMEFPGMAPIENMKRRRLTAIEADRDRWFRLHTLDRSDADARLWMGRHLWAFRDPEGIYYIKSACELRDTLTEAFEESTAGFARMLESSTGESRGHQLKTVEALVQYAFMKKRLTPRLWAWRGMAHLNAGNLESALHFFSQALELDPALALAHQGTASARLASRQPAEALDAARLAIRLDPHAPEPWLAKAQALSLLEGQDLGECGEALAAYFVLKCSSEALNADEK